MGRNVADILVFLGLIFVGIGLWLVEPWLSFVVVGGLLIVGGVALGRK